MAYTDRSGWEKPTDSCGSVTLKENRKIKSRIIQVDRTERPVYPPEVARVIHPELELVGPSKYDFANLQIWMHEGQKRGAMHGREIYQYLKGNGSLPFCLGVKDAEALRSQGGTEFYEFVESATIVPFWSAITEDASREIYVLCALPVPPPRPNPFRREPNVGPSITLQWAYLNNMFGADAPALMFQGGLGGF